MPIIALILQATKHGAWYAGSICWFIQVHRFPWLRSWILSNFFNQNRWQMIFYPQNQWCMQANHVWGFWIFQVHSFNTSHPCQAFSCSAGVSWHGSAPLWGRGWSRIPTGSPSWPPHRSVCACYDPGSKRKWTKKCII